MRLAPVCSAVVAVLATVLSSASAGAHVPHGPAPATTPPARFAAPRLLLSGDDVPPKARTPEAAARELLVRHAHSLHLDKAARGAAALVDGLVVDQIHDTGRGGILVAFRHVEGGLEVWHDALKVLMQRGSLSLVAIGGQVHAAVPASARFSVDAPAAAAAALTAVGARARSEDVSVDDARDAGGYARFSLAGPSAQVTSLRHARVKPVWAPDGDLVVPGYVVEIAGRSAAGGDFAYRVVVDGTAGTGGRVLQRVNLHHEAAYTYRVWADVDGEHRPLDGPLGDVTPYPLDAPDGHYPPTGPANLVTIDQGFDKLGDPWLPDGATETTGNNCDAFTDDGNPDGFSPGDVRGAVTAPGVFDHNEDFTLDAEANDEQKQSGAVTLFYLVNWLHDWWYDSGFDEAGHDAQESNYGRGGTEGDPLWALSQYAAPFARDNSAMNALDDGASPEMQMFVWSGRDTGSLTANGAGLTFNVADFGPSSFDVTADASIVDDGTAPNGDGCQPITTDLTGKVAVIDRGLCEFVEKVNAAEAAGAVAVIIVDNDGTEQAPPIFGDPNISPQPDIPVVSLSLADGQALEQQIGQGTVTIALQRSHEPDIDGGLDTTVTAHEWGHYLHLRQVVCESQMCGAESEGWGDFNALMTIVRDGDDLHGAFPMGVWATHAFPDDPAYFGIRRYPYSVDQKKNPLTFADISDSAQLPSDVPLAVDTAQAPNSEAHAAGEVWAAMMFESFIAILERSQETPAPYDFEGARRRMGDIVEEGMKLAPADPSFTDMRDALLAAAVTFDQKDADAVAAAFARRGAGTCAVSPPPESTDFHEVVEDKTVGGSYVIDDVGIDDSAISCDGDGLLDGGETGRVTVTIRNVSTTALEGATVTLSSPAKGIHFGQKELQVGRLLPFESAKLVTSVSLDESAPKIAHSDITAKITAGPACSSDGLTVSALTNGDDVATGLTKDTVEGSATSWTTAGDFSEFIWAVVEGDAGNHLWNGFDAGGPTDTSLVSPALSVSKTDDFTLSFKHRHVFEADQASFYDGGVIEISSDGGTTWNDIATVQDPGYEGTIGDTSNQAHNPLKDRPGFVGQNASYPAFDDVSVNLGKAFAGQTVQVRFRIATDEGGGGDGWDLDDIAFGGIDNAPFSGLIENAKVCRAPSTEKPKPASAPKGCAAASPESALGLVALLLVARRRRRGPR